jgi:GNAT superfamily N-acetyltransferase
MQSAIFGTVGGPRYQLLHQPEWRRLPDNSRIVAAHDGPHLVGALVLSEDSFGLLGLLLAVNPDRQGEGIGRRLLTKALEVAEAEGKALAGTIECENQRSHRLATSTGLRPVAHLKSRTFTRSRPRNRHMRRATPDDLPHIQAALKEQSLDWYSDAHLDVTECWVTPDLDAGVQLMPQRWALVALGGMPLPVDKMTRRLLPLVGIQPRDFVFATAHNWWGTPARWQELFEHAMHTDNLQAIVVTGDEQAPPWKALVGHTRMGTIGTLVGSNTMDVVATAPFSRPLAFTPLNAL